MNITKLGFCDAELQMPLSALLRLDKCRLHIHDL